MEIRLLPSALLYPRRDARQSIPERVSELAESIKAVGLLSPLVVRPTQRVREGRKADAWEILAGYHRYRACSETLCMDEIPCVVFDEGELKSELVMLDENLCRSDLSTAQRSYQAARRKEVYELLHPETAHGGDRRSSSRQIGDSTSVRFTAGAGKADGRSERSVQRDVQRGEALGEDMLRIAGTSLDKPGEIDALVAMPSEQRADLVKRAASGEIVSARKSVSRDATESNMENKKRKAPIDKAVADELADQFAIWIMSNIGLNDLSKIIDWLEGSKTKAVIAALRRLTKDPPPIMDGRYGKH